MSNKMRYGPELEAFIIDNSDKYTNRELAELALQKFGRRLNMRSLQSWKKRRKVPSIRKNEGNNAYLDWELDLIAWFCTQMTDEELSDWFLLVWNRERTAGGIKSVRRKYGIFNGRTGYWNDKGHEKNAKWAFLFARHGKIPSTCFKKGQKPSNLKEMGSVRLNKDGYYEVKTNCKRHWQYRARLVWEEAHGPIPKGYCVMHIDGDKTNDTIENLVLLSTKERLQVVARLKIIEGEKDFNQAVINLAKLQCKEAEYARISKES